MVESHIAESIPLNRIRAVSNYMNYYGKSLSRILRETGADYAINGTLYNMRSGKIVCHLRQNGKTLCKPPYTVWGYGWQTGSDIRMEVLPSSSSNYVACTALIVNGSGVDRPIYNRAQGGRRGRTAIGMKDGRLCLYCSKDGSREARTPGKLRDLLLSYGWTSAVMLDGGGSSQARFANGRQIYSKRRVRHLILVYLQH